MINLIVSCTNRKRSAAPPRLHAGDLPRGSVADRLRNWIERLETDAAPARPALDLYAGDHWAVALSVADSATLPVAVRLWVCSAGYGLVPASANLRAYSATFSPGQPDSVTHLADRADRAAVLRQWWAGLAEWRGPANHPARTLAALASNEPSAALVFVGSENYVTAVRDDLLEARTRLANPDNLIVFSAGTSASADLRDHLVPLAASLQPVLGGALGSLNVRAARYALQQAAPPLRATELRGLFSTLQAAAAAAARNRPSRSAGSDDEVREFITAELRGTPRASHGTLLRQFRDAGRACSYERFGQIYRECREGSHELT